MNKQNYDELTHKQLKALEHALNQCTDQVKMFVSIIVRTIVSFYSIDYDDRQRDLIHILAMNMIINGEVYFILFNLHSMVVKTDIQALKSVMSNKHILSQITLSALNVKP